MHIITITQKREQYGGCGGRLRRLSVPFTIVRRQVMLHDDEDDQVDGEDDVEDVDDDDDEDVDQRYS